MALMKLTLVARNALDGYLIASAEAGLVTMSGASRCSKSDATRIAASWLVAADHDPVGVEAVVERGALAEELRVGDDEDVVATEQPLDPQRWCRPERSTC